MNIQESILKGLEVKLQSPGYVKLEAFAQMWTMNKSNSTGFKSKSGPENFENLATNRGRSISDSG